jgi:hypothetical protein
MRADERPCADELLTGERERRGSVRAAVWRRERGPLVGLAAMDAGSAPGGGSASLATVSLHVK